MNRVTPELRAGWRELEAEQLPDPDGNRPPAEPYDRGYLAGWHELHRHLVRVKRPDGGYRNAEAVAEFRLGYDHGRQDGAGHPSCPEWDHAHRIGSLAQLPDGCPWQPATARRTPAWEPVAGSVTAGAIRRRQQQLHSPGLEAIERPGAAQAPGAVAQPAQALEAEL